MEYPAKLMIAVATISSGAVLAALVAFVFIAIYYPWLAKRVSLRLAAAIGVMDLVFAVTFVTPSMTIPECVASAFLSVFSGIAAATLTVMIALNIMLLFVFRLKSTEKYEPLYYILALGVPFTSTMVALQRGHLGLDELSYSCTLVTLASPSDPNYSKKYAKLYWDYYYSFIAASALFCVVALLAFAWAMFRYHSKKTKPRRIQLAIRLFSRLIFYPLVLIACQSLQLGSLSGLDSVFGPAWTYCALIANCSQGLFNSIIFFFDPAVQFFLEDCRRSIVSKYVLPMQTIDQHTTSNVCAILLYHACSLFFTRARDKHRRTTETLRVLPRLVVLNPDGEIIDDQQQPEQVEIDADENSSNSLEFSHAFSFELYDSYQYSSYHAL